MNEGINLYEGLTRDNAKQIIESNGDMCVTRIIKDEKEYCELLNQKLKNEVDLLLKGDMEARTLAEMIEIIYAIGNTRGLSCTKLNTIRVKMANKLGRFAKRVYLHSITHRDQYQ